MTEQMDDKIKGLAARVEKLQAQKNILLKELDEVETRLETQDRMYRKFFPIVLDMVSGKETAFSRVCADLAAAMRKKAGQKKLAYIFEQMKTAMINEDIGPAVPKKKGMFSVLRKKSSASFLDEFKQGYLEMVNVLKSRLDQKYTRKLESLSTRISAAEDSGDINEVREDIFSLIFLYISETSQDREKFNDFIREVMARIVEIETSLASSFDHADSLVSSNEQFETVLSQEVEGIKTASDTAPSLDELKAEITRGLASIELALKKKQKVDEAISRLAEKNRDSFKVGFVKLRKQLAKTTKYSEALEKKLNQDQLTGAYNRRAYDKKIVEEMNRFLRYNHPFALLVIDADKFKRINDSYGHAIGDRCLKEIIKRAHPLLRKNDMLARYGGEEFAVILPETDEKGGREVAEKIRQTIEKIEFLYKKETVRVTVSIGVSCAKDGDTKHEQVFERADMAVYKAKENGRNQVMVQ